MRRVSLCILLMALLAAAGAGHAQEPPAVVPSLSAIAGDDASLALKNALDARYQVLVERYRTWQREAAAYNSRYGGRSYDADSPEAAAGAAEQARLAQALNEYERDAEQFKGEVAKLPLNEETARVVNGMAALATRLGWSDEKRARLDAALKTLDAYRDAAVDVDSRTGRTWQEITRRPGAEFAREAAKAAGVGFPGAGTQSRYDDCVVFALANAAGVPYGVVAARANKLIAEGSWRSKKERANPQEVFKHGGLNGGEVIMLAEVFGQAEVIPRSSFAATLQGGRPIMVKILGGHEVVLTKSFQHRGETWYEMMDSYQGPLRRLYLNDRELNIILRENGVAFRPDPGTTPQLLRQGGDR